MATVQALVSSQLRARFTSRLTASRSDHSSASSAPGIRSTASVAWSPVRAAVWSTTARGGRSACPSGSLTSDRFQGPLSSSRQYRCSLSTQTPALFGSTSVAKSANLFSPTSSLRPVAGRLPTFNRNTTSRFVRRATTMDRRAALGPTAVNFPHSPTVSQSISKIGRLRQGSWGHWRQAFNPRRLLTIVESLATGAAELSTPKSELHISACSLTASVPLAAPTSKDISIDRLPSLLRSPSRVMKLSLGITCSSMLQLHPTPAHTVLLPIALSFSLSMSLMPFLTGMPDGGGLEGGFGLSLGDASAAIPFLLPLSPHLPELLAQHAPHLPHLLPF